MSGYPVILNGDHAEFELEHADMLPQDRPDWPLPSFDARDGEKPKTGQAGALPAASFINGHEVLR